MLSTMVIVVSSPLAVRYGMRIFLSGITYFWQGILTS